MSEDLDFFKKHRQFLNGTLLEYIAVSAFFALITFILTGWVVLDINNLLFVEAAGDGTSGALWLAWADTDLNPIPSFTNLVNYPDGLHLANPMMVTYAAMWFPLWFLSRLFHPIAALNILTMWGFFATAMSAYWLLKRLTGNVWVALFAGFAVAFVPYHIVKSSAHLDYIFSVVFVLILAAFIGLWQQPSLKRALLLAVAIALAFYTDGYYILLGSVFAATLVAGGVFYEFLLRTGMFWPRIWQRTKYLLIAGLALGALLLPIAFVQLKYGKDVSGSLAQSRGDIVSELYFYAAKPYDYLIPSQRHPAFELNPEFIQLQSFKNARSNPSESTLYLGYTVILLAIIGGSIIASYFVMRKKQTLHALSEPRRQIFLLVGSLAFVSVPILFLFSLSPQVGFAGLTIPLPGQILVALDLSFWRVLARFFLPLHVILTVFAAVSLWVLLITYKRYNKQSPRTRIAIQVVICLALVGLTAFEYATLANRPGFNFKNLPPAYTWLKEQKDVEAVVEFPFVARPWEPSVQAVTAQILHGKKLLNLHIAELTAGQRNAFVSIENPEAIDFATSRGAVIGVTRDEPCTRVLPWLTLAYDGSKDKGYGVVCMYYLKPASVDWLFTHLSAGFMDVPHITKTGDHYNVLYGNFVEMRAMDAHDNFITKPTRARMTMTLTGTPLKPPFTGKWRVLQDEKVILSGDVINSQPVLIDVQVDATKPVQLRVDGPNGESPQVGQVSLQNIVITEQ